MPSNGAGRLVGTQSQYTYDTVANAVAGTAHHSFTLTPSAGGRLSLVSTDTFTFALQVRSNNASSAVPSTVQFYLRTSPDSFAADVGSSTPLSLAKAGTATAGQAAPSASIRSTTSRQPATATANFTKSWLMAACPDPAPAR